MSTPPDVAIAVPFDWTAASHDLRLSFASGPSPVDVVIPTAEYRMNLAQTASTPADFLRTLASKITDALALATRAETCTISITTLGLVTITLTAPATWVFTANLRDALGLNATTWSSLASVAGDYVPRGLYLFAGGDSSGWRKSEPIAGAVTASGASYGVRSALVTWTDEVQLEFIPLDPDARSVAAEVWSPWENLTGNALPYPVEGILTTALARRCAFSRHWQAVRASTSELYDLVTLAPDVLSKPDVRNQFPSLTTWKTWRLPLVRTGTATR